MDNFTLAGLKERFDQEVAQTGKVTLDQRVLGARKNLDFVAALLGEQLVLTNARATPDQTVSPGRLTVTGNPETDWMIQGVSGAGMTAVSVSLVYEGGASGVSDSAMVFEGALTIGAQPVLCGGTLADGGGLQFALKGGQTVRAPLQAAADFVAGSRMTASFLPAGVELFVTLPITAVELTFGLSYRAPTRLRLTSDVGGPWNFIEGINLESLKNVGIRLFSTYTIHPNLQVRTTYGGDIHADFALAGHDLEARLALNHTDVWEIELAPKSNGTLPGLLDLADALGVKASVQTALNTLGLGDISVLDIAIGFSLKARKLLYLSIVGRVRIVDVDFDLWIRLPDFQFGGGLARGASISFRRIVEHFFSAAHNLPDVIVEEFSLAAQPSQGAYSLVIDLREEGFTLGPVTLEGLNLAIEKTQQGFDGSMTVTLAIAKATVHLSAKHPNPDAGWQFEGATDPGQAIAMGVLVQELAKLFGNDLDGKIPASVKDLTIEDLGVWFDTKSKDFRFTCKTQFPVDGGSKVTLAVSINLTHGNNSYTKTFGAHIEVKVASLKDPLIFTLNLVDENVQGKTTDLFVAAYSGGKQPINLGDLIRSIVRETPAPDWTHALDGISIELKDALFAFSKTGEEKKFLFGLDIGADISLAQLPLVGKEFPPNRTVGINDLQILVASKPFSVAEVRKLNGLIPAGVTKLPDISQNAGAQNANLGDATTIALKQGLNVGATLKLGDTTRNLSLPVVAGGSPQTTALPAATSTTQAVTTTDNASWLKIQKSLGPVHFERIGVQYKDAAVWFLLDAALGAAGLTLSLDGLSIGSPISKFEPRFDLRGIGIDYRNDALEIGGAFLKIADKEYAGAAVIKARQLTLSALGMYKEMADGHPSVFVYAVLDYPIGGPAFFFVTGLAAGFGYSRALKIPAIDKVESFSLVQNARKGAGLPKDIGAELQKLRDDITPAAGENFLAIGVKFTSFKIVDSFALLTISFGSHFEMNLLGLSSLVAPPNVGANVPPVAEVQLALKASFLPDKGFLGVQAQLTPNSYLLSKACHLTGGFAFYSWFAGSEHDGDFVLTLGGYHPHFRAPEHYPAVPRLGFNWQVSPELSLKGDAYFALTASALMAGGHLEANWLSGSVHAWFKLGADFLIAWKPYHYEIAVYVDMGVEVTFEFFGTQHISIDVGADLSIWGPEFSGEATIHLWIISFTVKFGAAASHKPEPIDWPAFKSSFLPADKDVCSIAVTNGMIGKDSQDASDLGVINPKHFSLATNSVVPSTTAQYELKTRKQTIALSRSPGRVGIGSMAVAATELTSTQTITIKREGDFAGDDFEYTPVFKNVPTGLWGESLTPEVNGKRFVENALSGFEIRPKTRSRPGETAAIERRKLRDSGFSGTGEYRWESVKTFAAAAFDTEQKRRDELRKTLVAGAASRNAILAALGFTPDDLGKISLSAAQADDFLIAPQIEQSKRM